MAADAGRPEARRVLMSAAAAEALAAELHTLRQAEGAAPFEVLTLEAARDDPGSTVHAAFISRDVTGRSSKTQLSREVLDTYAVLRRSPALAWVHTHSAGADRPIYGELRARGVAVTTSSGANAGIVAQTALAGLLALWRRFPQLARAQHEGRWSPLSNDDEHGPLPRDLGGQTAVIVGWGPIARTLQPWLAALGLRCIVVRHGDEPAGPAIETLRYGQIGRVLPQADWLVLACPLTDETRRLIDADAIARLPARAAVVNVARGEVVDEAALAQALAEGRLAGAVLDVFETEPLPPASPLWRLPNVLVTPHSAGHAAGNAARVQALFADNLGRWLRGESLRNLVA